MSKNSDDSMIFVAGTLMGVVAGVLAGLFLSPRSGKEMREEIVKKMSSESMQKIKENFEHQVNKIYDSVKASRLAAAKVKEEEQTGY